MRRFESAFNFILSIILLFSFNLFACGEQTPEARDKDSILLMQEYLHNDDQDLLIVPSQLDLLAWSQSSRKGCEFFAKIKDKKEDGSTIHIYQLSGSPTKNGWNTDDTMLFFDTQKTHLKEETPKKVEEGYLNTLLIASVMDELY